MYSTLENGCFCAKFTPNIEINDTIVTGKLFIKRIQRFKEALKQRLVEFRDCQGHSEACRVYFRSLTSALMQNHGITPLLMAQCLTSKGTMSMKWNKQHICIFSVR